MRLENISDIYVRIFVSILLLMYLQYERNNSLHSMLYHVYNKKNIYSQVWPRMISKNYVRPLVIYYLFIEYSVFGTYSLYKMLDMFKDNSVLINNKHQENIANSYVSISGDFKPFSH